MRVFIVLLLLSLPSFAADKPWQDATITKIASSQGPLVAAPVGNMWVAGRVTWIYYVVESGDTRYALATRKILNVTLKKPTKLALDGQNAYLLDDSGKTQKLRIMLKVAITDPSPAQTAPASVPSPAQASAVAPH